MRFLLLCGVFVFLAVSLTEAKVTTEVSASSSDSEVDSWLLEKELAADLQDLEEEDQEEGEEEEEGSGDDDDDDEEYDDEDYDDDDDLEEEGSGSYSSLHPKSTFEDTFIDDLEHAKKSKANTNKKPNNIDIDALFKEDNDFHFSEDDDLLSEYYDEEYEPDYFDEEERKSSSNVEMDLVVVEDKVEEEEADKSMLDSFLKAIRPSYVYLTVASALLSFGLALAVFFVCRNSSKRSRRAEKKLVPFVVGDHAHIAGSGSSSIVKSYHRVPTGTKEFLGNGSTRVVDMPSTHNSPQEKNRLLQEA